jgi:hypothetical protein
MLKLLPFLFWFSAIFGGLEKAAPGPEKVGSQAFLCGATSQ